MTYGNREINIFQIIKSLLLFISIFFLISLGYANDSIQLPDVAPVELKVCGNLKFAPIVESSGIVRSRLWPEVLWTHNDSGDKARIFPVKKDGSIISPSWSDQPYEGVILLDAVNVDWEDIAIDKNNNLIVGAFGNNGNARRDLAIYILAEPNPYERYNTRILFKIPFVYPDQKEYPAKKRNFDAEALFYAKDKLYILSKNRADDYTKLYRFDSTKTDAVNVLTLISSFNIRSQVTAADANSDGTKIAVLTYRAVWLFESQDGSDDYFNGKISWLPIKNGKICEGICFYDDSLIISNEQRSLFEVKTENLYVVRDKHVSDNG